MVDAMRVSDPTVKKLLEKYKEMALLSHISALLNWDLNVNLPPQATASRAEQLAYITQKMTLLWLDTEFRSLLESANQKKGLSPDEEAIIRNLNLGGKYYFQVPKEVIIQKEEVTAAAFPVWNSARAEGNFKKFLPHLEKIIEINREIARHLGYQKNPYDALLDMYEPELTAADCERLFTGLKKELVPLIKKITASKKYLATLDFLEAAHLYPIPDQEKLLTYAITAMGFDLTRGRVNVSPHPFTIGLAEHDVRLTTAYSKKDFRESLTAAMHEAGHGLYEQNIAQEYADTPLGGGVSLGIHEALSRFWENMVGKNPAFLNTVIPLFRTLYTEQLKGVGDIDLIKSFNLVKPSLIRIHADEVTYSLHIILRFEMENTLLNGEIEVKDAPAAWNKKSQELFGITPSSDSEGVLQDVHWTYGSFGYFPSYALGNLYGAQFLHTMNKSLKFETTIGTGMLRPVKEWFDTNIHRHGSRYLPKELLTMVTNESLNHRYFIEYLTHKYTKLYEL